MTDTETTVASDTSFTTTISEQEEKPVLEEAQNKSHQDKSTNKRTAKEEPDDCKETKARKTSVETDLDVKVHEDTPKPSCSGVDSEISNQPDPERKESAEPINSDEQTSTVDSSSVVTVPSTSEGCNTALIGIPSSNTQAGNPLPLLSEQQHQQLLQTYAQANGQDLANLTASSLAQAMVSPIALPGLTQSLLQHLQGGNVITTLPGPPQLPQPTSIPQDQNSAVAEDVQTTKRGSTVRNLTNDERRQRRLLRNRVAAKECRKKKKQYIHDMEEKIQRLETENATLRKEVEELTTKLSIGGDLHNSESYRLMKEVEELNAKLGMGHLPTGSSALTTAIMAAVNQQQQSQAQPSQPQPQPQTQPQPQPQQHHSSPQPIAPRPISMTDQEQRRPDEIKTNDVKVSELDAELK
ncbi:hypothetical protein EC973_005585 [Apophysomyces ossiformis]|uniref:BZIP domain-containing protein n=1 Tax=Apophysomyces ossiformis TaxID=679940 RepID=A0A8H7BRI3_9FUNG|nr:hypothetical protein EC973_005585 [Apophysomyces ossiformis]